jgi:hypothetical protein
MSGKAPRFSARRSAYGAAAKNCDYDEDNDNESDAIDAAWLICFTC